MRCVATGEDQRPERLVAEAAASAGRAAAAVTVQSVALARRQIGDAGGVTAWLLGGAGPAQSGMSWLRKRVQRLRNPRARIIFQEPVYAGPGFTIEAPRGGSFVAGPGTEFRRGFRAELDGSAARIEIGAGTVFTSDAVVQAGAQVTVGEHCQIDYGVLLADGNYRFRRLHDDPDRTGAASAATTPAAVSRAQTTDSPARSLTLGDDVTVTTKCTVIADIGTGTMVGANSVVAEPLPAYALAAGSPATVIGYVPVPEGSGTSAPGAA